MSCTDDSGVFAEITYHNCQHATPNDTGHRKEFTDEPLSSDSSSSTASCVRQASTSPDSLMGAMSFSRSSPLYSHIRSDEQDMFSSEYNLTKVHAYRRSLWRWRSFAALLASTLFIISAGFWNGGLQVSSLPRGSDITSSSATVENMPL